MSRTPPQKSPWSAAPAFAETCKFIVNPYDEYAVEEAVRLAQKVGQGEVIVVTVGKEEAAASMRAPWPWVRSAAFWSRPTPSSWTAAPPA